MKTTLFRKYKFLNGMYKNEIFSVYYSDSNKKYEVDVNGKTIYHGAKSYKIKPGTKAGDNYCSRSFNISYDDIYSANFWSRLNWNCVGKISFKGDIFQTKLGMVKII